MILRCLLIVAIFLSSTLADVKVTTPAPGDSITGTSLSIEWEDNGKSPSISDFASYQIFLCAGGNDATNFIQLATLVSTGDYANGDTATAVITPGLGADVANAYFLKFISAAQGGSVINYSSRFSLTSMTGVFPPVVLQGIKTISGTTGPPTENQIATPQDNPNAATPDVAGGSFAIPFAMQTGPIKYAPMPPIGQTKITAKNAAPLYPTSAYVVFQTYAGTANALTTVTEALTNILSTRENTAAPAPQPTDTAMQRFLERWKD